MRQDIRLFIKDKEVEFAEPFHILMNHKLEDITEPTAVKNNYTKSIKLPGTAQNNKVFGNLWDVRRAGDGTSYDFDLTRKNEFKLFMNGELVETGYVKLLDITSEGNEVNYSINLFGGLGDFFYSLDYAPDGENKKTLADLDFGGGDKEFNMILNAKTVESAWDSLYNSNNDVYSKINFAPCLNGIPEDFSSNKCLVKMHNNPWGYQPGSGLSDDSGYFMAEFPKDVTEWQARDLRAYMQRPVLRVRSLFGAISDPGNNGGYNVILDPDFFNTDNPYYDKSWITLPLLGKLTSNEEYGEVFEGTGSMINIEKRKKKISRISLPGATWKEGDKGNIEVKFSLYTNGMGGTPEISTSCFEDATASHGKYYYYGAYFVQLVAKNATGTYVAGSQVQYYGSFINIVHNPFNYTPLVDARFQYKGGLFKKGPDGYTFPGELTIGMQGVPLTPGMTFELVVSREEYTNYPSILPYNALFTRPSSDKDPIKRDSLGWDVTCQDITSKFSIADDAVKENVNKKKLLTTEKSPLDYLLSYTKQFGLSFLKDNTKKEVRIMSRNSFYNAGTINIDKRIDRSKPMKITPLTFNKKWYDYELGIANSKYAEKYKNSNDTPFGVQRVNTNYDFDKAHKNLLSNNVYKNAVMLREKDFATVDYVIPDSQISVPPAFMLGAKVSYWDAYGNATEKTPISASKPDGNIPIYDNDYDASPKLNFYNMDGKPVDGENVLVFMDGWVDCVNYDGYDYYMQLSDDIPEMMAMNDGKPCWQQGAGIDIYQYPIFSRYWTKNTNNVICSFNAGNPLETFTYDYTFNDTSSVYSKYWKNFISDQYDRNTRIMECNVKLGKRVLQEHLRNIYYFDGSYWCLIEVRDYDLAGSETTKCRFIKIQDPKNYRNGQSL